MSEDALVEFPCGEEWPAARWMLCKPHRCDLMDGHEGPHVCNCGRKRR